MGIRDNCGLGHGFKKNKEVEDLRFEGTVLVGIGGYCKKDQFYFQIKGGHLPKLRPEIFVQGKGLVVSLNSPCSALAEIAG